MRLSFALIATWGCLLGASCDSESSGTAGSGGGGSPSTSSSTGGGGGSGGVDGGGGQGGSCSCAEHASCDEAGACVCDAGFEGDGTVCVNINECFTQADNCAPSATCIDTAGSFECECPEGATGDPLVACTSNYVAVAAGLSHTCAIRSDGATMCFGNGRSGRLGNGQTVHQASPVQAGAASNWLKVVAGSAHTCGIKETSTLWCWGSSSFGQLGLGAGVSSNIPAYLSLEDEWSDVATGDSHSCAIRASGELYCFGRNNQGQLGIGSTIDSPTPVAVSLSESPSTPDNDWLRVAAGRETTCALKTNGRLYCWGRNSEKQVGPMSAATLGLPTQVETAPGNDDSDWSFVATSSTTCAGKLDGTLYCFGRNLDGELGTTPGANSGAPVLVDAGQSFTSVAVGGGHVCAVTPENGLRCWGRNTSGQVNPSLDGQAIGPSSIEGEFTSVSAGTGHTCGVSPEQEVLCWGTRNFGQLGDGSFGHSPEPLELPGDATFTQLSVYNNSVLAVRSDGAILGAGRNEKGQLGLSNLKPQHQLSQPVSATSFEYVGAGTSHACAISAMKLFCTGDNTSGQLGRSGPAQQVWSAITTAGKPWASANFVSVSGGESHSCAVTSAGKLYCFGLNTNGQLGATNPPTTGDLVEIPAPTTPATTWTHVSTGAFHSCGRTADSKLLCWGRNVEGQIGINLTSPKEPPTLIGTDYSGAIGTGNNHTCAVKNNGSLFCWGTNTNSQLGDNTATDRFQPTAIGAGTTWQSIAAGNSFSCALNDAGEAYCWGTNSSGQLGVGDLAVRKLPTALGAGSFSSIELGGTHACALRADGSVLCWGSAEFGQNALGTAWPELPKAVGN